MNESSTTNALPAIPALELPTVPVSPSVSPTASPIAAMPFAVNSITTPVPTIEPLADVTSRRETTQNRVAEISSLLNALEAAASESGLAAPNEAAAVVSKTNQQHEQLAAARLGVANSLLKALRYKHPHTAAHSLRVALGCSAWAEHVGLDKPTRDTLEFAALMYDIGKIGASEGLLLNPNRLTDEEQISITKFREMGLDILTSCCGDERILEAVSYVRVRYDGQGSEQSYRGAQIPLAARMISIVDAYDAMTTDQVYRPAKSPEGALNELFEMAGKQFDPTLVKQFSETLAQNQALLTDTSSNPWLENLDKQALPWQLPVAPSVGAAPLPSCPVPSAPESWFEEKLIETMHDGVVFVDSQAKITRWSKGAERLTGVSSDAAVGRVFTPSLLEMCSQSDHTIPDEACPIAKAIITNTQIRQRLLILGRQGEHVAINLHAIPVHSPDCILQGATVLLLDAQPEASLEEKCEALHAEVTRDPMTKVANRAEFDRMLALFIETHQAAKQPCSLVMVDIDHFKKINDTYGHQAGDEAIISMANLLSSMCRTGDLVSRYGGEEFTVLCADCTNADGARRAEQIRRKLSELQHACLGNKRITASFGVTELQAGDTPETMLRRSDRALLMAKEQGRNQVVQLGNGMDKEVKKKSWWKFANLRAQPVVENTLISAVPIDIAIEKLRGFVSDHQAKIVSTNENTVELEVSSEKVSHDRRKGDSNVLFRVELEFSEIKVESTNSLGLAFGESAHTKVKLKIRPKRHAKRRKADMAERARLIHQSIKAYLMAKDESETAPEFSLTTAH